MDAGLAMEPPTGTRNGLKGRVLRFATGPLFRFTALLGIALTGTAERWRDAAHAMGDGTVAADIEVLAGRLVSFAGAPDTMFLTRLTAGIYPRILAATQVAVPWIENPAQADVCISTAGHFTAILLCFFLARRHAGSLAYPAAAFFALHPAGRSVAGAVSGEATLIAILLLGLLLLDAGKWRARWSLPLTAAAALLRPDGFLIAGALAAARSPGRSLKHPGLLKIGFLLAGLASTFLMLRHYGFPPAAPALPAALLIPGSPLHAGAFSFPNIFTAILLTLLAGYGAARIFSTRHRSLPYVFFLYCAAGFLFLPRETRWIYPAIPLFFTCAAAGVRGLASRAGETAGRQREFHRRRPLPGKRLGISLLFALAAILLARLLPGPAFLGGTGLQPFYRGPDKWVVFSGEVDPAAFIQDGFFFRNGRYEYIGEKVDINEKGTASIPFPLPAVADSPGNGTLSTLRLYENGIEIGPAHAPHHLMKTVNDGRFSHWETGDAVRLFFSSSDNIRPDSRGKTFAAGDFFVSGRPLSRLAEPAGRIDAFSCFLGGGAAGGPTEIHFSFKDAAGKIAEARGSLDAAPEGSGGFYRFRKIKIAFTRAGARTLPSSETITATVSKEPGFDRNAIRTITVDAVTAGHAPGPSPESVPDHTVAALLAASGSQQGDHGSFPVLCIDQPVFVRVHALRGWFFVLFLTGVSAMAAARELSGKNGGARFPLLFAAETVFFGIIVLPAVLALLT